jgi:hypothetical protein
MGSRQVFCATIPAGVPAFGGTREYDDTRSDASPDRRPCCFVGNGRWYYGLLVPIWSWFIFRVAGRQMVCSFWRIQLWPREGARDGRQHAAAHRETVKSIGLTLGFASHTALRNLIKRYTGQRASDIRACGGREVVAQAFERKIAAWRGEQLPTV